MGAKNDSIKQDEKQLSFNPRTRDGCEDTVVITYTDGTKVSIHAPVMGANNTINNLLNFYIVSIHAPVMGAKQLNQSATSDLIVSIHAPVMGAKPNL